MTILGAWGGMVGYSLGEVHRWYLKWKKSNNSISMLLKYKDVNAVGKTKSIFLVETKVAIPW